MLYRLTLIVAAVLGTLIIFSPLLPAQPQGPTWGRVCFFFSRDVLVRKTAVVSAVGLWVTAVVFFRPRLTSGK